MSVELSVELKMGAVTISYVAPSDAELFWIDESEFIQKIMDLMKYVGTADAPPPNPAPEPEPPARWSTFQQAPLVVGSGDLSVDSATNDPSHTDYREEENIDDFFEDTDTGGTPQGNVVGRVSGIREVRA
jgi:hypothetical protein